MGDGFRALEGEGSQLVATIEATCRFEAMTKYYALLGRGSYDTDVPEDHEPYSEECAQSNFAKPLRSLSNTVR